MPGVVAIRPKPSFYFLSGLVSTKLWGILLLFAPLLAIPKMHTLSHKGKRRKYRVFPFQGEQYNFTNNAGSIVILSNKIHICQDHHFKRVSNSLPKRILGVLKTMCTLQYLLNLPIIIFEVSNFNSYVFIT